MTGKHRKFRKGIVQISRFFSGVVVLAFSPLLFAAPAAAAGGATMSLTPSSGSFNPGNTVTVTVVINSNGNNVNTTQANFSYPSALLQFKNFDYGTSVFGIQAESSASGGSVRMARGTITPVNGSSLVVGKVVFTVLSTGSATLSIAGDSTVVSSDTSTDILGTKNGASYTITAPAPPPSTGGGGTSTGTTNPTTSTSKTSTTTKTTTPTNTPATAPATQQPESSTNVEQPEPTITAGEFPDTNEGAVATDTKESFLSGKYVAYGAAALGLLVVGAFFVWWMGSLRHRPKHSINVVSSLEKRFTPPLSAEPPQTVATTPETHTIRPTNVEPTEATLQQPAPTSTEPENDVPQLIRPDSTDKK